MPVPTAPQPPGRTRDVVETLLGFARVLRGAGVDASPDRVEALLLAVRHLDVLVPVDVYWAGRATLTGSLADIETYDSAFSAYFGGDVPRRPNRAPYEQPTPTEMAPMTVEQPAGEQGEADEDELATAASGTEVLRHRDVAQLSVLERAALRRMFAHLKPDPPTRASRRQAPANRGGVDVPRTVRRTLRNAGELTALSYRAPRTRPRRLVVLVDVSGSMAPYADALLRFAHIAVGRHPASTDVFTIGTRLTRVTRALKLRDPDKALAASGEVIPDWSGGTRLGEGLKAFLDRYGQRGTARGAVVVLCSDGWERGDATLLGEQMQRLARLSYSVVWVNPHKGKDGYAPLTAGMQAALPYVDEFVAGHSMAALEKLVEVVRRA